MSEWKAEVVVTGVPCVSEAERTAMLEFVSPGGVVMYDATARTLRMVWRFGSERTTCGEAIGYARYTWWRAAGHIKDMSQADCTDFRVHLVTTEEEAAEAAELKKIFRGK